MAAERFRPLQLYGREVRVYRRARYLPDRLLLILNIRSGLFQLLQQPPARVQHVNDCPHRSAKLEPEAVICLTRRCQY